MDPHHPRVRFVPLLVGLAIVLALVAVVLHFAEGRELVRLLRTADLRWLGLALLLQLGTYAVEAGVWRVVLAHGAVVVPPLLRLYGLSLAALFTSQSVPSAGLAGTVVLVRSLEAWRVPAPVVMATVLVDLVAYYAAYAGFVGAACFVLWDHGVLSDPVLVMGVLVVALGVAFAGGMVWLTGPGRARVAAHPREGRVGRMLATLASADPHLARAPCVLGPAVLLRGGSFALDAATLWACLAAVGHVDEPGPAVVAFVLGSLARTVGIVPGGLGTFEAATVGGLAIFGVAVEAGVAAVLLFRGLSFWLPMVPGLWLARRLAAAGGSA